VDNVDFSVYDGEILGIIGPNGAGKTTLLSVINAHCRSAGTRSFSEARVTGLNLFDRRAGISRTFQIVKPFPG